MGVQTGDGRVVVVDIATQRSIDTHMLISSKRPHCLAVNESASKNLMRCRQVSFVDGGTRTKTGVLDMCR